MLEGHHFLLCLHDICDATNFLQRKSKYRNNEVSTFARCPNIWILKRANSLLGNKLLCFYCTNHLWTIQENQLIPCEPNTNRIFQNMKTHGTLERLKYHWFPMVRFLWSQIPWTRLEKTQFGPGDALLAFVPTHIFSKPKQTDILNPLSPMSTITICQTSKLSRPKI